jgi:hypothetical protein
LPWRQLLPERDVVLVAEIDDGGRERSGPVRGDTEAAQQPFEQRRRGGIQVYKAGRVAKKTELMKSMAYCLQISIAKLERRG